MRGVGAVLLYECRGAMRASRHRHLATYTRGCHMTQSQIAQLANAVRWGHMTPDAALSKARAAGSEKSLRRALGL